MVTHESVNGPSIGLHSQVPHPKKGSSRTHNCDAFSPHTCVCQVWRGCQDKDTGEAHWHYSRKTKPKGKVNNQAMVWRRETQFQLTRMLAEGASRQAMLQSSSPCWKLLHLALTTPRSSHARARLGSHSTAAHRAFKARDRDPIRRPPPDPFPPITDR